MSDESTGKASEDRVAQAMQAIMQLREETEVLARAYGVPDSDTPAEAEAESAPAEVAVEQAVDEPAAEEVEQVEQADQVEQAEQVAAPALPRPAANRYDTALEVIHSEAIAGLRALASHGFRAGSSFLDLWRTETARAIEQWRDRAGTTVEESVQGADVSIESAVADLKAARARLSDLSS